MRGSKGLVYHSIVSFMQVDARRLPGRNLPRANSSHAPWLRKQFDGIGLALH